jgi:hypothetical protein
MRRIVTAPKTIWSSSNSASSVPRTIHHPAVSTGSPKKYTDSLPPRMRSEKSGFRRIKIKNIAKNNGPITVNA